MDVIRSSSAKDRLATAIESSGVTSAGAVSVYRERPLPTAAAILWTPIGKDAPAPVSPIFITQRALEAVHAQVAALPERASSLGFLVGSVCLSPDTRIPYIVVESTIHIPWAIAGDRLESALRQGRTIAHVDAERTGNQLLGWYHSLVPGPARLSVADIEAHAACFEQAWSVAMVVARGAELTGGMFRIGSDVARSADYLPFYVLPGRDAPAASWANYRAHRVSLSTSVEVPLAMAAPPPLLFPDEDVEVGGLVAPSRWRALAHPVTRIARVAGIGLVIAAALFGGYRALASGPARVATDSALPGSAAAALERPDRLADSVAFALTAFDLRMRLFDARKMTCADLAHGLVELETRWIAYNSGRRLVAAHRQVNDDVGVAERRFARTGCPRP